MVTQLSLEELLLVRVQFGQIEWFDKQIKFDRLICESSPHSSMEEQQPLEGAL